MDYQEHKDYFKMSYQNGADIWTHLPNKVKSMKDLVTHIDYGASILDLGSGRGLVAKHLAEMGFKVTGIDFDKDIVAKTSEEIENWGLKDNLKFLEADVFHLPFPDASFDAVCDIGLLQNLYKEDWDKYIIEINRVLKPGGFYVNLTVSRKTKTFLGFSPINSSDGEYDNLGLHYHFFDTEELEKIFGGNMKLISDHTDYIEEPTELMMLQTFWQKNT
ncbi:MAG: methyltransferase domain-containing protein [Patescibacteria group bacterium]